MKYQWAKIIITVVVVGVAVSITTTNMSDVFSYYRYAVNCIYELTARNCSERVANFVFSYEFIGLRLFVHYQYDCDLDNIGKLLHAVSQK